MFDTYRVTQAPAYPQHVHHHRQSTSEDAKLLRDLEKEAVSRTETKVVATLGDNVVTGIVVQAYEDPLTGLSHTYCIFSLNNHNYKIKVSVDRLKHCLNPQDYLRELYDAIGAAIAGEIMSEVMRKNRWT